MSSPRVKVLKDGAIYLNQKEISLNGLITELLRSKENGFGTYFYREAALSDPPPKVKEILDTIVSAGIPIKFGDEAPSEWGELETFMITAPYEFHFAIFMDGTFTYLPVSTPGSTGYNTKTSQAKMILHEVDALISANRIIETQMTSPERAFMKELLTTPSLHIVVKYDGNKLWRSYYLKGQTPGNVESLLSDCKQLGKSMYKHTSGG